MNSAQQTARVGLLFLLGVALVWVTFETLSDGKLFEPHGVTLIAKFDDLKQLKSGDDVRMAGVKIGSVQKTQLEGRQGEAVLQIEPKIDVPGGATAGIERSKEAAIHALMLDPLSAAVCNPSEIKRMTLELFDAEKEYLPGYR